MTPNEHYFSSIPNSPYKITIISAILCNQIFELYSAPGVFSSRKVDTGTSVLLKNAHIPNHGKILDLGCGIGVIGVVIGVLHPNLEIHFMDINSRGTELTKLNSEKYNLKSYTIYTGDYLKILEKNGFYYDTIYFNPPIRLGKTIYLNQIVFATQYLKFGGIMQIVIKKKLGAESVYDHLRKNLDERLYSIKIIAKNSGYWVFALQKNA